MSIRTPVWQAAALAAVLVARPGGVALAQEQEEPVVIGTRATIHSEVLDEDRRLLIGLPDGYELQRSARYPVLYLLDGGSHFHHVSGIVDFLAGNWHMPPMIVVGITNTQRTRDLTPPTEKKTRTAKFPFVEDSLTLEFPTAGGADDFLRFLTEELAPYVEDRYRTAPFRVLVGHSAGCSPFTPS